LRCRPGLRGLSEPGLEGREVGEVRPGIRLPRVHTMGRLYRLEPQGLPIDRRGVRLEDGGMGPQGREG
jgi:hypothetical protein